MNKTALITAFLFMPSFASAHEFPEKEYQARWCAENKGITEVALHDKSRVDCLTSAYAVEVDFAPKWAEAIGQSLYYSIMTGRKPGIVLIIEHEEDERFFKRMLTVTGGLGITVWVATPNDIEDQKTAFTGGMEVE